LLLIGSGVAGDSLAQQSAFTLGGSASPTSVAPAGRVAYEMTVDYAGSVAASGVSVTHTLPAGFRYVFGTARLLVNGVRVSSADPAISGQQLTWSGLGLPAARTASHYGMHTFVQDKCETNYIRYQLDRVRELMGPGAHVKQLFYGITTSTSGPNACWVEFVNGCYDRGLIPIVRLQGPFDGANWVKPPAASPGDYTDIAAAHARVVNGLPRRDGATLYVEVWNEPNLNLEWGGAANAVEYAEFLVDVAAAIRGLGDGRIKLLNGGLSPGGNIAPTAFIDAMATVPGALQAFDVWSTHPYPGNRPPAENIHDGTANDYADLSIDAYLIELQRLADHGRGGLQVLLTETGYELYAQNLSFMGHPAIDESNRAAYMVQALRDYWSRWPEVLGVCPFELVDPFGAWPTWDWLYPDGRRHAQYDAVLGLDKSPVVAPSRLLLRFEVVASATPGIYSSQLAVTSANAGSASLLGVAPVTVVAPTPSPSPTPSPTPIPTVTPTITPTPLPGQCSELLLNGGFEDDAGWQLLGGYPAGYSREVVRDGERSVRVGIVEGASVYSYSSAWQAFHVPDDALEASLSLWVYPLSQDLSGVQRVGLLNEQRAYLETVMFMASNAAQWQEVTYDLSSHRGQTRWLYLGVYNPGGSAGITGMYVDDASVLACRPTAVFTPTMRIALPITWTSDGAGAAAPECVGETCHAPTVAAPAALVSDLLPLRPQGLSVLAVPPGEGVASAAPRLFALDAMRPQGLSVLAVPPGEGVASAAPRLFALDAMRPQGLSVLAAPPGEGVASAAPRLFALDAMRQRLVYAAQGRLRSVDALTGRVLAESALAGEYVALEIEPVSGAIHLLNRDAGRLTVVDASHRPLAQVEGLGRPSNLAVSPDRVYIADPAGARLLAIDRAAWYTIAERALSAAPHALAYDPLRQRLYVGLMGRGAIVALDAATLQPLGDELALGGLGLPQHLALDADAGRLAVAHSLSPKYGGISLIDTETMTLLRTRWGDLQEPLSGAAHAAFGPSPGELTLRVGGRALLLDADTLQTRRELAVDGAGPLAVDRLSRTVYLAARGGGALSWRE
jgi:uncharacterized repeat protein (TIGR01451 family)